MSEPWEEQCEAAWRECESWGNKHISRAVEQIIAELRAAKAENERLKADNERLTRTNGTLESTRYIAENEMPRY